MLVDIVILSLVVYRLAILITEDEGPYSIFKTLRTKAGGYDLAINGQPETNLGRGIMCPLCVGIWLSFPLALVWFGFNWYSLVYALAVAGLQALLSRITK